MISPLIFVALSRNGLSVVWRLSELYPDQVARALAGFDGIRPPGGGSPGLLEPLEKSHAWWGKFVSEDCRTLLAALQGGEDIAPLMKAIEQRKSAEALEQWKSAGSPNASSAAGVPVASGDAPGHIQSLAPPDKQGRRLVMLLAGGIVAVLLSYLVLRKVQRR